MQINIKEFAVKKTAILCLVLNTHLALFGAIIPEDKGSVNGLIRLGYVDQDNDTGTDRYTTAIGTIVKYETPAWKGLKIGIAGYGSQKLPFATGSRFEDKSDKDFLSAHGNSFTYLGEAYVDYAVNDFSIRVGRQLIDTPLVNTDDIRMLPNTFEAATATYKGIEKTTITAGFIKRWAGYDSPRGHTDSMNEFKKFGELHASIGTYLIGVSNESIDRFKVQGWYYSIDEEANIGYTDGIYKMIFSDSQSLELSAQIAHYQEDKRSDGTLSNTDGYVYGLAANYEWKMATLGAAYNQTFNKDNTFVNLGLGSGPFYTSVEEWTLSGMEDAKAYRGSLAINVTEMGIKGLTLTSAYGLFKSAPKDQRVEEWDVIANYTYDEAFSLDISYANINDKHNNATRSGSDAGYNRFLARLHYRF